MNAVLTRLPSHFGSILFLAVLTFKSARAWGSRFASRQTDALPADLSLDDIITVKMRSGQVYYGLFAGRDRGQLCMKNVHRVHAYVDPATKNQGHRLVSHDRLDWHAAELGAIARVERMGRQSRLAQLIGQDKRAA